ncbi:MAG: AFG1/ZapE family ATPase [Hyphomicrobium sp.]
MPASSKQTQPSSNWLSGSIVWRASWPPGDRGAQAATTLFARPTVKPPRGLYVHGDVGRGKTMLMDLFFACVTPIRKQRSHFHEFMADVHERIAKARREVDGDPHPARRRRHRR